MTIANRRKAIAIHLGKARKALSSAELLAREGHLEAAVNRSYYCAFHAARAALLTLGVQPRTHKGVNQRFNLDLVLPGKIEPEYLSLLGRAETERESADYALDVVLTAGQAFAGVEAARRFLARIDRYLRIEGFAA